MYFSITCCLLQRSEPHWLIHDVPLFLVSSANFSLFACNYSFLHWFHLWMIFYLFISPLFCWIMNRTRMLLPFRLVDALLQDMLLNLACSTNFHSAWVQLSSSTLISLMDNIFICSYLLYSIEMWMEQGCHCFFRLIYASASVFGMFCPFLICLTSIILFHINCTYCFIISFVHISFILQRYKWNKEDGVGFQADWCIAEWCVDVFGRFHWFWFGLSLIVLFHNDCTYWSILYFAEIRIKPITIAFGWLWHCCTVSHHFWYVTPIFLLFEWDHPLPRWTHCHRNQSWNLMVIVFRLIHALLHCVFLFSLHWPQGMVRACSWHFYNCCWDRVHKSCGGYV